MILENGFDTGKFCCFCGADNSNQPRGYGGERGCGECGKGGEGQRDEKYMAYKGNLPKNRCPYCGGDEDNCDFDFTTSGCTEMASLAVTTP